MSSEELRLAACAGKHPFPTKLAAMKVAKRAKDGSAEAFRCPHCGKFHIGRRETAPLASRRKALREMKERYE